MSETFRVTIDRHTNGYFIGSGTRVVQAADKDEAGRVAVAEALAFQKEKNTKVRAEMARTGLSRPLASENPVDYVVKNVRRAPQRRSA